jgi:hypothetical protein
VADKAEQDKAELIERLERIEALLDKALNRPDEPDRLRPRRPVGHSHFLRGQSGERSAAVNAGRVAVSAPDRSAPWLALPSPGTAATLTANVAHRLGHGLTGTATGAWPAVAIERHTIPVCRGNILALCLLTNGGHC